jgi:tetratricopeptide (TPR) repeat protein
VGQYDRAIDTELKCIRRQPKLAWAHVILGWAYEQKKSYPEALAELRLAVKLEEGDSFATAAFGQALAASGDRRGASAILADLQQRAKTKYVSAYDLALIYAGLGDKDHAFERLNQALLDRSSFLPYITWDRRADPLRTDPRFDLVVRKLGLPRGTVTSASHLANR